jgi:hypothetical protein
MFQGIMAMAQFPSHSTAGIVNVMLGFEPDFAIFISNHGGTNPDVFVWANAAAVPDWVAALSLKITGSTGVITRDTTGITVYAGGDKIATTETAATAGKHVDEAGTPSVADAVTRSGLTIPADQQTNSGDNLLVAFRRNR